ncbi:uncharacterized protein C12orf45 homolog [Brienomyrus brachyistius]|uniref:uncharacterized protein C12orf45 homolog n=1 Tax=Brienomyrus brachyistius TaxID=42636 RepID=UPI0020B37A4D|nr:uncharacterized protein C12orf45 homolog [Brienomyrus brachyistius]
MEQHQNKGTLVSKDLLSCGDEGGLHDKLLLKSKTTKSSSSSSSSTLQTTAVPRSSVLDRLQLFLPQIAQANEKLKQEMESCPTGRFDIENVEDAGKVIEMDVALVDLGDSDSDSEDETSDDDSSDSEFEGEITEDNLKLPGNKKIKEKANIKVLGEDTV